MLPVVRRRRRNRRALPGTSGADRPGAGYGQRTTDVSPGGSAGTHGLPGGCGGPRRARRGSGRRASAPRKGDSWLALLGFRAPIIGRISTLVNIDGCRYHAHMPRRATTHLVDPDVQLLQALAHPTRLAILRELSGS